MPQGYSNQNPTVGRHNTGAQNVVPTNRTFSSNSAGYTPEQGREFVSSMHQQQQPSTLGSGAPAGASQGLLDVFSDIRGLQQNQIGRASCRERV